MTPNHMEERVMPVDENCGEFLRDLLGALPELRALHRRDSKTHTLLAGQARQAVRGMFAGSDDKPHVFGPFGSLRFPYESMGAVDSLDLFGLDELIIFSFYWENRGLYRRVADLGANIGLHSFCQARCGFEVRCFEPDPVTFEALTANLERNGLGGVTPIRAAVSSADGEAEFVRVHGNRTGSHLAGAKANPYGDLERFKVDVVAFRPIAEWADLLKIDVEGHEAALIESTDRAVWETVDAMVEVGTANNAADVYDHLTSIGVNMFSQKCGWRAVRDPSGVPTSHREGSLFVTLKPEMPWGA